MTTETEKPVFRDLSGDDLDQECTEVESMCMNCHKNVSLKVGVVLLHIFHILWLTNSYLYAKTQHKNFVGAPIMVFL